jgi:DNA-binding LacI/PurR family transcriptional regulator
MSENKFSNWMRPALTTLRLPTLEMADLARRFLKNAVDGATVVTRQCLPVTFVERESAI